jgi:GNAT superfamily N-acetyltransferase
VGDERPAAAPPAAIELTARDGRPVLIRPIAPDDKERLREGFGRLSEESRIRRFLSPVAELTDEQVRHLTEVDYVDHMAWVAVDPSAPALPGIGVARYVRVAGEPTVAEAAVTVVDEYQGQGIGTMLLGALAISARAAGITTFSAYVLEANVPMMEILLGLGADVRHEDGGVLRLDVPLPERPEDLPDTPTGRVFKAVAQRLLPAYSMGIHPDHRTPR